MKNFRVLLLTLTIAFGAIFSTVNAQEEEASSPISVGADIVSTYVWRGTAYSGPSIQPYVDLTLGGFSIGAWGSQGYDGFQEMDAYLAYGFDFGLSLGLTDYYYPGSPLFELGDSISSHAFEINAGYEIGSFTIGANYILNNSSNGAGSAGNDMYFELGYSFSILDVFVGAGDGWHTTDGEFAVCNVGVSASKEIAFSDKFSLPMFGSVIVNPESEQFYIVAGVSF